MTMLIAYVLAVVCLYLLWLRREDRKHWKKLLASVEADRDRWYQNDRASTLWLIEMREKLEAGTAPVRKWAAAWKQTAKGLRAYEIARERLRLHAVRQLMKDTIEAGPTDPGGQP